MLTPKPNMYSPHQLLDSMPETKQVFLRRLRSCPIDHESFLTPLRVCSLSSCQGMCCYDGVVLAEDEAHYIGAVVKAHPEVFDPLGISPETAFEPISEGAGSIKKTATKPFSYAPESNTPEHFARTACVFRLPDARCSLQSLAIEQGEHPWAYKPPNCWLHPITLHRGNESVIWLPTKSCDPLQKPGYPGFASYSRCGECTPGGEPAYKVLGQELQTLGAIIGRDLIAEIVHYERAKK